MKVWAIAIGEPLPLQDNDDRLHRCGLIVDELVRRNHEVTWWSSNFNHFNKKHIFKKTTNVRINDNLEIILLNGWKYNKNISLARILNHFQVAEKFKKLSYNSIPPEKIICAFPSIELAYQATIFAQKNKIPIIIDARDMWPDIFISVLNPSLKSIGKMFFKKYFTMTKYIFSHASHVTGITESFVDWAIKSYARREKKETDRAFYLGYPSKKVNEDLLIKNWDQWRQLDLYKENKIITYLGVLADNKIDLETVFKAAKMLEKNSNVKFVIAGDGDQKELYEKIVNNNNLKNVILPGWINENQICSLLQNSFLGLVPIKSRKDFIISIPNKPIEYLSYGLPLLSSLSGELEKLIKQEKIGYSYRNEDDIVNIINKMILKDSTDMKLRCKNVFETKFNSKKVYSKFCDFIEQC